MSERQKFSRESLLGGGGGERKEETALSASKWTFVVNTTTDRFAASTYSHPSVQTTPRPFRRSIWESRRASDDAHSKDPAMVDSRDLAFQGVT